MRQTAKMNAIRSGIVVLGALAFGWMSLELAYKPILNKAQTILDKSHPSESESESQAFGDQGRTGTEAPVVSSVDRDLSDD